VQILTATILSTLAASTTGPTAGSTVDATTAAISVFTATMLRVALTIIGGIVVALVLRHLIHRTTSRVLRSAEPLARFGRAAARTVNVSLGGSVLDRRAQRAETLNSILGSTVNVVVGLVVITMVMGQLGWDIGPIIASAGIVGVAVGFGAQSLVKDVLSGIFMMLEDQYGVGDQIDIGPTSGTVEAVALRVTRLRDANGMLWYCRNGEILRVGNSSQGWARAVVDVRVGPESDLDQVSRLLTATASALAADDDFADAVIGEPSVAIAEDLSAAGTPLRLTLSTESGQQTRVASELRRRIRTELNDAGVVLAA
jgi:small-conductance mechanosensitive channel